MLDPRKLSFGSSAGIVASMALIVGLDAATATTATVVGSILIAGLADNLTDSLSVHMYQESERLPEREAFRTTLVNFAVRLAVSLSFALLFVLLPRTAAVRASLIWGFVLLSVLSYVVARRRSVPPFAEIWKHGLVATVVIAVSKGIGSWILRLTAND